MASQPTHTGQTRIGASKRSIPNCSSSPLQPSRLRPVSLRSHPLCMHHETGPLPTEAVIGVSGQRNNAEQRPGAHATWRHRQTAAGKCATCRSWRDGSDQNSQAGQSSRHPAHRDGRPVARRRRDRRRLGASHDGFWPLEFDSNRASLGQCKETKSLLFIEQGKLQAQDMDALALKSHPPKEERGRVAPHCNTLSRKPPPPPSSLSSRYHSGLRDGGGAALPKQKFPWAIILALQFIGTLVRPGCCRFWLTGKAKVPPSRPSVSMTRLVSTLGAAIHPPPIHAQECSVLSVATGFASLKPSPPGWAIVPRATSTFLHGAQPSKDSHRSRRLNRPGRHQHVLY